jgi:hypothetical protein
LHDCTGILVVYWKVSSDLRPAVSDRLRALILVHSLFSSYLPLLLYTRTRIPSRIPSPCHTPHAHKRFEAYLDSVLDSRTTKMFFGAFTAGRWRRGCRSEECFRRFWGFGVELEAAERTYVVHAFDRVVLRANLAPQNTTRCLRCGAFEGYGIGLAASTELCSQALCHGTPAQLFNGRKTTIDLPPTVSY